MLGKDAKVKDFVIGLLGAKKHKHLSIEDKKIDLLMVDFFLQ